MKPGDTEEARRLYQLKHAPRLAASMALSDGERCPLFLSNLAAQAVELAGLIFDEIQSHYKGGAS